MGNPNQGPWQLSEEAYQRLYGEWSLEVTQLDYKVARIKFEFGSNYDEMIAALETETKWEPYGYRAVVEGHMPEWQGLRDKLYEPNHPLLQRLLTYWQQDKTKEKIVDALYETKSDMEEKWGMPAEKMYKNVQLHGELTRDQPGFENGIHCDYRRLVATGMIFFTNEDNVDHSTHFYDNPQRDNPLKTPSNFGEGWLHGNDWNTWHDGWNRTDKVRYSMLIGVTLLIPYDE